jgi:hypothetical protein
MPLKAARGREMRGKKKARKAAEKKSEWRKAESKKKREVSRIPSLFRVLSLSLSKLEEPNQRASPIAWISSFTNVRQAADSEMSVFLQEKDSRLKFFFFQEGDRG